MENDQYLTNQESNSADFVILDAVNITEKEIVVGNIFFEISLKMPVPTKETDCNMQVQSKLVDLAEFCMSLGIF